MGNTISMQKSKFRIKFSADKLSDVEINCSNQILNQTLYQQRDSDTFIHIMKQEYAQQFQQQMGYKSQCASPQIQQQQYIGRAKLSNEPKTQIRRTRYKNLVVMPQRARLQKQSVVNITKKSDIPKTNVNGSKNLSKAQKRKLRMKKRKNENGTKVQSKQKQKAVTRPSNLKPPLRNRNSIMPTVEKNDEKLSN